ncbi:hypothetical protein ABEB36_015762 [Hypothenemus hampei]|uniref:Uncharacterized protein n=1 Tax=Hypothenemus hampei TaxID=57062 RepID=A0ABD1E0P6_HYPHA
MEDCTEKHTPTKKKSSNVVTLFLLILKFIKEWQEEEVPIREFVDQSMRITKLDQLKVPKNIIKTHRKQYCTMVLQHLNLFGIYLNPICHNIQKHSSNRSSLSNFPPETYSVAPSIPKSIKSLQEGCIENTNLCEDSEISDSDSEILNKNKENRVSSNRSSLSNFPHETYSVAPSIPKSIKSLQEGCIENTNLCEDSEISDSDSEILNKNKENRVCILSNELIKGPINGPFEEPLNGPFEEQLNGPIEGSINEPINRKRKYMNTVTFMVLEAKRLYNIEQDDSCRMMLRHIGKENWNWNENNGNVNTPPVATNHNEVDLAGNVPKQNGSGPTNGKPRSSKPPRHNDKEALVNNTTA